MNPNNNGTVQKETVQTTQVVTTKPKKSLFPVLTCGFIILLLLAGVGVLAAASVYRGTNRGFASVNNFIPTEKLPLIKDLGKSDEELFRDSFAVSTLSLVNKNEQQSSETRQKFNVKFNGTEKDQKYNGDITYDITGYTDKNKKDAEMTSKLTGSVKSGAFSFDLAEGVNFDSIIKDENDMYLKVKLPQTVIDSVKKLYTDQTTEAQRAEFDNFMKLYNGNYVKYSLGELTKDLEASSSQKNDGSVKSQEELMAVLDKNLKDTYPELKDLFKKTIGDTNSYATVNSKGRTTVNGMSGIEYDVTFNQAKLADATYRFVEGLGGYVNNNKSNFVNLCVDLDKNKTRETCQSETDKLASDLQNMNKEEAKKNINAFFEYFNMKGVNTIISPENNQLLRLSFTLELTQKAKSEMPGLDQGEISYSYELVSFGKDKEVKAPENAKTIDDIKKDSEKLMSVFAPQYQQPSPYVEGDKKNNNVDPEKLDDSNLDPQEFCKESEAFGLSKDECLKLYQL